MIDRGSDNTSRPGLNRPPLPGQDPVVRFLGPGASKYGPFGVLGLPVCEIDDAGVLAAVQGAMARIDSHAEAGTPAADEARLAVHAAAANLLDDAVRSELLRRLASGRASDPGRVCAPSALCAPLEADVLRCIASGGGWNKQAMRHFLKIAHQKGHTTGEAMHAIRTLWRGGRAAETVVDDTPGDARRAPRAATPAVPNPGQPARASEEQDERASGVHPAVAVLLTVVVFTALFAVAWFAWERTRPPAVASPAASQPERTATVPERAVQDRKTIAGPPVAPAQRVLDNGPAIIHELEVAVEGLAIDAEGSLRTFEQAVAAMAEYWTELNPVDRLAAHDQIIGFIYRVGGRLSLAERAMRALESGSAGFLAEQIDGPGDVTHGAWSIGVLVRLRREQNLPGTLIRRIDGVLIRTPGGLSPNASTFQAGAAAALRSMARSLREIPLSESGLEAWGAWRASVRAASVGDDALMESLILNALEGVLRRSDSPAAQGSIAADLVSELNWRPGGAARVWLLRAFDDRTLGPDDLHVLTLALATRSRAEGVDHSMVLPRGSSGFARRRLRDEYRALWGLESRGDQGEAVSAFAAAARAELAGELRTDGLDQADRLASIVRLARLNAAGELAWRAETAAAEDLLETLDAPIAAVLESEQVADASRLLAANTGTWAQAYLDAGTHIPRRLELLGKLGSRRDRLGPMEAEVLVAEAFRGSPQRVRDAAAAVVEASAGGPVVVNAVLELLPMMPRTDRNTRIVELVAGVSLPRVDSADWALSARRSLVERLLELIAGRGVYAVLDALALLLDEAYGIQDRGAAATGSSSALPPAGVSARALADAWSDLAAHRPPSGLPGLGVDEIERRRAARLAMADGLVQAFHAEQLALAEFMAQVVAAEQPGFVAQVGRLADAHRVSREQARDVLAQIEHTERFMLSLRLLRFGEERG